MGLGLSPPWYIFASEIKYTYGLCPLVKVNDLAEVDGEYHLVINVCDDAVALALRQILPLSKDFGGTDVDITIFNSKGEIVPVSNEAYTPETLAETFCLALKCNPLFGGTILTDGKIPPEEQGTIGDVAIIIDRCVIQFYADDISDLCSNYNEVAAQVFYNTAILDYPGDIKVSFTTYDRECELQKDIFC